MAEEQKRKIEIKDDEHAGQQEDMAADEAMVEDQKAEEKPEEKTAKPDKKQKKSKKDKEIEELNEKNKEIHDKYLRLYSEFDNFRKRTLKEKIDLSKNASKDMIIDLLPILDDFERAMQSMEGNKQGQLSDQMLEGVLLIYNKLKSLLKAKGLEEIDALGKDFDTDYHEAVTQIPAEEDQKGKVVDVIEKGYLLNDKVIRYAKVVVGQ